MNGPADHSGTPGRIRLRLDALQPFLADLEQPLTFGDLQVVFGLTHHDTQKAIRVLRQAQLLTRGTSGRPPRPAYHLEKATVTLLTPIQGRLPCAKALACFHEAVETVAAHNAAHRLSRVTSLALKGSLLDPNIAFHEAVPVEVTALVQPAGTLVQDIDQLVRGLRRIGDRALRISLILEFARRL